MLSVRNLTKTYAITKKDKKKRVTALNKVSIDFPETGLVFLLGKSGSGKSTLLNSIGGLDSFDKGEIIIKGKSSKDFSQSDFDSYRNTFIGFIFQEYNVLENFTVAKNLAIAIELQGKKANKEEVDKLLEQVEMLEYAKRKPNQLSGGQKQRVAIARALIKNPEIIMADEPTGALDSNTGKQVMETLKNLSKTKLVIIVSHDREFAEIYGDRIIELKDGKVISDVSKKDVEAEHTKSGVSVVENRYIHIKKGQKVTKEDIQLIVDQINNNNDSDTIISLNEKTNKTIKNVEFIQDDGSKQAFLETKPEDVKTKEYNGKDLKLIKSRLKFKDSFKMGAGALKNKVGRLVFTIILSIVAFTMFGVVDAFASWNRGNSVYEGIQQSGQKIISVQKEKKGEYSNEKKLLLETDVNILREKFPEYSFIPTISICDYFNSWGNISAQYNGSNAELKSNKNPIYTIIATKATSISTSVEDFGFSLEGRLPENSSEIAITKHLWENIKGANSEINADNNYTNVSIRLENSNSYNYQQIVGIVDTKDGDYSKYKDISDVDLQTQSYTIEKEIMARLTNYVFIAQTEFDALAKKSASNSISQLGIMLEGMDWPTNSISYNDIVSLDELYQLALEEEQREWNWGGHEPTETFSFTKQQFIDKYFTNLKTDKQLVNGDEFVDLAENELILTENNLNFVSDIPTSINNGLEIIISDGWNGDGSIGKFKVIGTINGSIGNFSYNTVSSVATINKVFKPLSNGYGGLIAILKGNSSDKELIKFCETFSEDGIRYTIQNEATATLNMFENIITTVAQIFMYVGIVLAVFAAFMLMGFIATSITYKKREIGVLRALGARGSDVFGIFFNEGCVISLINFAFSAIATFIICAIANSAIIKEIGVTLVLLTPGLRQILLLFAISFGSAFLASLIPVTKIAKKKPIDAINNR